MPTPDDIFAVWNGPIDEDIFKTIRQAFDLPENDTFIYRAELFSKTLSQIEIESPSLKYNYRGHGGQIPISAGDITAYTSIFLPTTDTNKALTSFKSNAKKNTPRALISNYLVSKRISDFKIPKSKTHKNPYLDLWSLSCHLTSFLGPIPTDEYSNPIEAKKTHPILPVFYHHFGCLVPTYEALYIISELGLNDKQGGGIIDMGSGNGYWSYMLRRMGKFVTAVDNSMSNYRMMWIEDTVKRDGVEWLKNNEGGRDKVLLLVYPIAQGTFTERVLKAYKGMHIVIAGTQNGNRYTGFRDWGVEEWFERNMKGWDLTCRVALPSFAGKDEALYVWTRDMSAGMKMFVSGEGGMKVTKGEKFMLPNGMGAGMSWEIKVPGEEERRVEDEKKGE